MRHKALSTAAIAAIIAVFAFAPAGAPNPEQCELQLSDTPPVIHDLGEKTIEEVGPHQFWFSQPDGDLRDDVLYDRKTDNLNFDGLYRLSSKDGVFHFRASGQAFIPAKEGRTFLYQVEWANGLIPTAGRHRLEAIKDPPPISTGPTLAFVGDSITWWNDGRFLRCFVGQEGGRFSFAGSRTDVFGHHHEGEGGNNTEQLIARINQIEKAEIYFLLIGTNDRVPAEETVRRIDNIASTLSAKTGSSRIFVSTLLPRGDEFQSRNEAVNELLRKHKFACERCELVDLAKAVEQHDWASGLGDDKLHPNVSGYQIIASEIVRLIGAEDSQ